MLILSGANPNTVNRYGHTALHRAVVKQNENIVDVLLKGGADVNIVDNQNSTALHVAAEKGEMKR